MRMELFGSDGAVGLGNGAVGLGWSCWAREYERGNKGQRDLKIPALSRSCTTGNRVGEDGKKGFLISMSTLVYSYYVPFCLSSVVERRMRVS